MPVLAEKVRELAFRPTVLVEQVSRILTEAIIDGSLKGHFNGEPAYTDSHGYTFYYYEKELEEFNSIKVFANKDDPACSLTVTLWKDEEEVASSSSGSYAGYNDDDGTYELSVDPLYYSVDDDEEEEEENG